MENRTKVKINVNKEAVKMGELIEKGRNLRKFLTYIITISWIGILVLPLSIGLAKWLFNH